MSVTEKTEAEKKRSMKLVKFKTNDSAKHIKRNAVIEITAEAAGNFTRKGWGEIVK